MILEAINIQTILKVGPRKYNQVIQESDKFYYIKLSRTS